MRYYPPRYLFRRHEILRCLRNGDSFLEIGPGNLYFTQELLDHFEHGTVIEYNADVSPIYDGLPQHIRARLDLVIADFFFAEVSSQFDCVVACEVMEHVEDDIGFLKRIYSMMNGGGQIVLSVPAHVHLWSVHDEIVGHLRRYERSKLEQVLKEAGFSAIEVYSYGYPFVNLLRIPRIVLAKLENKKKATWTHEKQTKRSGLMGMDSRLAALLGIVVNPTTVYPLNILAQFFKKSDLSDGYVAVARKY